MTMQQSITFRGEPELEESFSFSNSYHFNTSSVVFSDPYDLCYSDDESYVEISLGPTPTHPHADQQYSYFKDDVEFRISFSSRTIPFPNLSVSTDYCDSLITSTASPSSSTMRFISSSAETPWDPTPSSQRIGESGSNDDERKIELPSVLHRFVNAFMTSFALRPSSQSHVEGASNGFKLVQSWRTRKTSNIASINSEGIMKFLIKLRSLNIGRFLASWNKKAYQSQLKTSLRCKRLMKPFDKWVVAKITSNERSKSVLDINMEAIKGVMVATGVSLGRKDSKIRSSPSCSRKSSPNHNTDYKTDNSIQAAIAHCKSSFCPN